jgi:hypothetical protein
MAGGVGMPGYSYGAFTISLDGSLTPVTMISTDRSNLVIIEANGHYIGVTPAVRDEFIKLVEQKMSKVNNE